VDRTARACGAGNAPGPLDAGRCYAVMGFGGNGITFSMLAARLITAAVLGRKCPESKLFGFRQDWAGATGCRHGKAFVISCLDCVNVGFAPYGFGAPISGAIKQGMGGVHESAASDRATAVSSGVDGSSPSNAISRRLSRRTGWRQ
jgi:hypothetical protein